MGLTVYFEVELFTLPRPADELWDELCDIIVGTCSGDVKVRDFTVIGYFFSQSWLWMLDAFSQVIWSDGDGTGGDCAPARLVTLEDDGGAQISATFRWNNGHWIDEPVDGLKWWGDVHSPVHLDGSFASSERQVFDTYDELRRAQ